MRRDGVTAQAPPSGEGSERRARGTTGRVGGVRPAVSGSGTGIWTGTGITIRGSAEPGQGSTSPGLARARGPERGSTAPSALPGTSESPRSGPDAPGSGSGMGPAGSRRPPAPPGAVAAPRSCRG